MKYSSVYYIRERKSNLKTVIHNLHYYRGNLSAKLSVFLWPYSHNKFNCMHKKYNCE